MSAPGDIRKAENSRSDWRTPPELFALLDSEFHFTMDAAASKKDALCPMYCTKEINALSPSITMSPWSGVFCNPPYGNISEWVKAFIRWSEKAIVVALLPAATDTRWFAEAARTAKEIRLLSGRVSFIDPTGGGRTANTTGSCVVVWKPQEYPTYGIATWDWRKELSK